MVSAYISYSPWKKFAGFPVNLARHLQNIFWKLLQRASGTLDVFMNPESLHEPRRTTRLHEGFEAGGPSFFMKSRDGQSRPGSSIVVGYQTEHKMDDCMKHYVSCGASPRIDVYAAMAQHKTP